MARRRNTAPQVLSTFIIKRNYLYFCAAPVNSQAHAGLVHFQLAWPRGRIDRFSIARNSLKSLPQARAYRAITAYFRAIVKWSGNPGGAALSFLPQKHHRNPTVYGRASMY